MSFRRWGGAFLQRILLFIFAGLVAVTLLHIPAGIVPPPGKYEPPTYSASRWLDATGDYLQNLSRGDLGVLKALKIQGYREDQPVSAVVRSQAPRSFALLGIALALSLTLGTLFGFLSSRFTHRLVRTPITTALLFLLSFPDILIVFLLRSLVRWGVSQFGIELLSTTSFGAFEARDLIAPALTLAALPMVLVARVSAVAFDEVHDTLYVRTARSKGLHPLRVVLDHVLKNAWIKVADSSSLFVGSLVTGLVVVEYSYYFPGIGRALGLMLERGGQPGAASSFALVLLVGAFFTDMLFGAIRLALDPRLSEQHPPHSAGGRGLRLPELRSFSPLPLLRGLVAWVRELPYILGQAAWSMRPSRLLRGIWRNPPLLIGLLGIMVLLFLALFGGKLADLRQAGVAPKYILHEGQVYFPPFKPGLTGYPLGSDMAGRDMLSRLLVGARYTLFFAFAVTPVRFLIAVPWGLIAGFNRGAWAASSRSLALMLSALPVMLIPAAILPVQAIFQKEGGSLSSFWAVTLVLAVVGVPRLVESIRQQVESTLVQPFVEGARAAGASTSRILTKHVLPHLGPQLWVTAAADMAWTMLLLAQLGVFSIYLGGSVSVNLAYGEAGGPLVPRLPDWSSMLSKPYDVIYRAPWAIYEPAIAFLFAIVIFNLTAEGLRRQAQRLSASAAMPEPEVLPDGTERIPVRAKRRLALEWTAAAMALILAFAGLWAGARYGRSAAAPGPKKVTAVDFSRESIQLVMDTIHGTGEQFERAKAISELPGTMGRYLTAAYKERLSGLEIQEGTRGRITLFTLDDVGVYQFQAPPGILPEGGFHSFLWLMDSKTGKISSFNIAMKPATAAQVNDHLILAGTVPGPDNWEIHFYARQPNGSWQENPSMAVRVSEKIPEQFNAKLVMRFGNNPRNQITMTGGPLNSARVSPEGDLTVCQTIGASCMLLKYEEYQE